MSSNSNCENTFLIQGKMYSFPCDKNRGKWGSQMEFFLACIGYAFGSLNVIYLPFVRAEYGGVIILLIYCILLSIMIAPIIFLESIAGQFARTGFISMFQMLPLFKGLGWSFLLFNLSYSTHACWSVVEPINAIIQLNFYQSQNNESTHIGSIICCFAVWMYIGFNINCKVNELGKILVFTVFFPIILLSLLFIRVGINPGLGLAMDVVVKTFDVSYFLNIKTWLAAGYLALLTLGNGIGVISTLASHNNSRLNLAKYAFFIPVTTTGFTIISSVIIHSVIYEVESTNTTVIEFSTDEFGYYLKYFVSLDIPYFWAIVFCAIIFLIELNKLMLTIFACVKSVADECVKLRQYKNSLSWLICGGCFIVSMVFSGDDNAGLRTEVSSMQDLLRICLFILEIFMITWMFCNTKIGSIAEVMNNSAFNNWKFFVCLCSTPISLAAYFVIIILKTSNAWDIVDEYPFHMGITICLFVVIAIPLYVIIEIIRKRKSK